jgi:hypothetical protein
MKNETPETENIDRLFLELSQFTKATTRKELRLEEQKAAALSQLEEIRTERLAACGLTAEASAVSAARVILQSKRIADEAADETSGRSAYNAEAIRGATVAAAGATNHTPTNDP